MTEEEREEIDDIIADNHIEKLKKLLDAGLDVNCRIDIIDGATLLHMAVHRSSISIVKLLIEYGAEINSLDNYKETPISKVLTTLNIDLEIAKLLVENGGNVRDIKLTVRMIPEFKEFFKKHGVAI